MDAAASPTPHQRLRQGHARLMRAGAAVLRARYGAQAAAITRAAAAEFDALIPAIPDIGGAANPLTDTLVQMASLLALYRVLKRAGQPVEAIGATAYAMGQAAVAGYPWLIRRLIGWLYMTPFWRARTRRHAARSQAGLYPGDFVYTVVEGGRDDAFDWGVDYHACGVVKFFRAQGADEFTPYMCQIDYLMFPAMGVGLRRTGTLAQGAARCDFRFQAGGAPPEAWPPRPQRLNGEPHAPTAD